MRPIVQISLDLSELDEAPRIADIGRRAGVAARGEAPLRPLDRLRDVVEPVVEPVEAVAGFHSTRSVPRFSDASA